MQKWHARLQIPLAQSFYKSIAQYYYRLLRVVWQYLQGGRLLIYIDISFIFHFARYRFYFAILFRTISELQWYLFILIISVKFCYFGYHFSLSWARSHLASISFMNTGLFDIFFLIYIARFIIWAACRFDISMLFADINASMDMLALRH